MYAVTVLLEYFTDCSIRLEYLDFMHVYSLGEGLSSDPPY